MIPTLCFHLKRPRNDRFKPFGDVNTAYFENRMEPVNTMCLCTCKTCDTTGCTRIFPSISKVQQRN